MSKIKFIALRILCLGFGIPSLSWGQVATAPLVPDQRLVNPAALAQRVLRGYTLNINRQLERQNTPGGGQSLTIDTQVDTLAANAGWGRAPYFFEVNLLPQLGTRKIKSNYTDSLGQASASNSEREINLIPIQALVATRLGNFGSLGIKALYTNSEFSVNENFGFNFDNGSGNQSVEIETLGTRSTGFLSAAAGGVVNLFETGFYLGFSSEYLMLKDEVKSQSASSSAGTGGTNRSNETRNQKVTTTLRKDIVGLGYLTKFSGGNIWRVDVSQERMPALSGESDSEGKVTRLVTEATWSYFHAGVQVTSTSGYYVDPYDLIPYYFSTGNYSNDEVLEYGFFGGLKSSKGHSFGISYSQSKEDKTENFGGGESVRLKTSQVSYGVSYMYLF